MNELEYHRAEALALAEKVEVLTAALTRHAVNGEAYRRINQRLGVALKLAGVHAHLAVAIAYQGVTAASQVEQGRACAAAITRAKRVGAA